MDRKENKKVLAKDSKYILSGGKQDEPGSQAVIKSDEKSRRNKRYYKTLEAQLAEGVVSLAHKKTTRSGYHRARKLFRQTDKSTMKNPKDRSQNMHRAASLVSKPR